MDYKPNDFFIGLMDFFSILLPGALVTFLLISAYPKLIRELPPVLCGSLEKWIAFLVASYILGHLLHHFGFTLDKWIYDGLYVKRWKRRKGDEKLLVLSRELMK